MNKVFINKIKKLYSMPPKRMVKKINNKLKRTARNSTLRHRDLRRDTHSNTLAPVAYSFLHINKLDISNMDKKASEYLCNMYLSHSFDLLGSGYTNVSYDMKCNGVCKNVYDCSLHIKEFDAEGKWLEKILLKSHEKYSRDIWSHISREYVPIDWQMDFKSGYRYSQKKWYLDQPIGKLKGVDIKMPWELCRFQHLPQLAMFSILFPEKKKSILKEFKNQIFDFIMANPPRMGVTWTCTMDVAIRAANMLIAYDLFKQLDDFDILDKYFEEVFSRSIYEHGIFIINNLEWNKDFAGNHYLSDICGLLFIAAYCKRDKVIDSWLAFSVQELISETDKQFYKDGSNFEASTSYHRLSGELLVYSTALIFGVLSTSKIKSFCEYDYKKINRLMPLLKQKYDVYSFNFFPEEYLERLFRAAAFTVDITKPNGNIPQIGDNDSGMFFKLSPNGKMINKEHNYFDENILNHDTFISAVNGFFQCEKLNTRDKFNLEKSVVNSLSKSKRFKQQTYENRIELYAGQVPNLKYSAKKEIKYRDYTYEKIDVTNMKLQPYPCFGLYIYKSDNFFLSIMAGGIGQNGNGGHSHNDKLSFELNLSGKDIFADPGTYLYTPLPEIRDKYRSVKAHNSPIVLDEEQCRFTALFSMKNEAKCQVMNYGINNIIFYLTYRDIEILREFKIYSDKLVIIDRCNKEFNQNIQRCRFFSQGYGKTI